MVNDKMGDDRNIVMADLENAAKAAGISVTQVVENLEKAVATDPRATKK